MGSERVGVVGRNTAERVRALRGEQGMSQRALSARLAALGVTMVPSAVAKVESGERRVDVDDLVALAIGLNVSPVRLLMPDHSGGEAVELTASTVVPAWAAWQWGRGAAPLPTLSVDEGYNTPEDFLDFVRRDRPADERWQEEHSAARAARDVVSSVRRVLFHAKKGKPQEGDLGLRTTLGAARRNIKRVAAELVAIEEGDV